MTLAKVQDLTTMRVQQLDWSSITSEGSTKNEGSTTSVGVQVQ